MGLRIVTAPQSYPVTLAQAKAHLRVDFDDDNDLIELLIKAATEYAENFTGRSFIDQVWDYYLDEFPDGDLKIPNPPLIEVVGVFYRDSAGAEQQFASSGYIVDDAYADARIALAYGGAWPTIQEIANAIRIRFRSGYITDNSPAVANVPFQIKAAILMIVGTLYAHRETIVVGVVPMQLPWGAEQLLRQYRVHTAIA